MAALATIALGAILVVCSLMMTAVVIDERGRANRQQARAEALESVLLKITRADFAQPDGDEAERLRRARLHVVYEERRRLAEARRTGQR